MTRQRAHAELVSAIDELWATVCELVLITLEDAPLPADLAVVDDLVDSVSGLQGDVAAWRELLAPGPAALSMAALAQLQHQVAGASLRYWRLIRAYEPVVQLRQATRSRDAEWRAWAASVQKSAVRCETPLWTIEAACHAAWNELTETHESTDLPADTAHLGRTP